MKTKNLTLFLILISTSIFGQIPKDVISIEDKSFNDYFQNGKNIPVVKGKILNLSENELKEIKINYSIVTPFEELQVEKNCTPNSDGTFELELKYAFPFQQIWLQVGKDFYAGIYANTDLLIELDAEKIKSKKGFKYNGDGVKYLGTDGELNSYLNNHVLFKRKEQLNISKAISGLKSDRKMDYDEFILKYDSLYSILNELDSEFISQNPSDYSWLINNDRQSDYYANLCVKHRGKEMSTELFEKIKNHKVYLTSNNGMIFYDNYSTYLESRIIGHFPIDIFSYRNYSKLQSSDKSILDTLYFLKQKHLENIPYDTSKARTLGMQAINLLHDTIFVCRINKFIDYLDSIFISSKSDLLKLHISSKDPNEHRLILETVLNSVQTPWCERVIKEQYNNSLLKLDSIEKILTDSKTFNAEIQIGQPIAEMPFGAKLYKVDTMDYEKLLANLKTAYKNKALIIDFWATWCGPCLHEMPYSKKLQNETKDLPVEFVYLCTSRGSDIDKWKSKIAEFEIGGTHIFVEQEIENKLMTLFSVSGFPSYVFIDKKGDYKAGVISRMSNLNKSKLTELID